MTTDEARATIIAAHAMTDGVFINRPGVRKAWATLGVVTALAVIAANEHRLARI